ncbi:ferrous iron transport protein B [Seleniivibrio sp.]|uniref:ferrous iron transport protein B n=1 Tax=Seleniivibrio sp. TaxID=2898801 RepID=UPI0025D923DA|nr:ferrous iron transport protein B [Seleniivibrio sp.]MCD8553089.1 ferrous iron transport protein B [Seleniivibrio sp.]
MKVVAIAGNPNCGKTSLFNNITGANYHVANYPGVTVEKKEAKVKHGGEEFTIVDLPGTYSLSPYSLEEKVARDYVVNEKPDVIVNVLDASNLERNLYMFVQFMEMGAPVMAALNMVDVAKLRKINIDVKALAETLNVPVVETVARENKGTKELLDAVAKFSASQTKTQNFDISYGPDVDETLVKMETKIKDAGFMTAKYLPRWTALKYLENDEQITAEGAGIGSIHQELVSIADKLNSHIKTTQKTTAENLIADYRYGYISSILKSVVTYEDSPLDRLYLSDRIDQVLTNKLLGPVIMLGFLYLIYEFTFWASEYPVAWLESLFGWLGGIADAHMAEGLLKSLVTSGIIDGVGGVLGFAPLILFMFFAIAFLEDSGYMARTAYMLDRVFRLFGLQGNSVVAYIVSGGIAGGCAVPGVMAARTIKGEKERLITILTAPFMPCGAKLPVYALLIKAFFPGNESGIMLAITLISWLLALLIARLLGTFFVKEPDSAFVMELPPYRMPTLKGLTIHAWERCWMYVRKAGTVILAISVLLWAMMTFPQLSEKQLQVYEDQRQEIISSYDTAVVEEGDSDAEEVSAIAQEYRDQLSTVDATEAGDALANSVAGKLGQVFEPVTQFAGFDWRTNIALIGGIAAKEVVVASLGTAYSLGEVDPEESDSLGDKLVKSGWTTANAISLIIFTLLYSPCFVTVVAIRKETGSSKWALFTLFVYTGVAFIASVAAFQILG